MKKSYCKRCQAEYEDRCKVCNSARMAKNREQERIKNPPKSRVSATPGLIVHHFDDDKFHRAAYKQAPLACGISTLEY